MPIVVKLNNVVFLETLTHIQAPPQIQTKYFHRRQTDGQCASARCMYYVGQYASTRRTCTPEFNLESQTATVTTTTTTKLYNCQLYILDYEINVVTFSLIYFQMIVQITLRVVVAMQVRMRSTSSLTVVNFENYLEV